MKSKLRCHEYCRPRARYLTLPCLTLPYLALPYLTLTRMHRTCILTSVSVLRHRHLVDVLLWPALFGSLPGAASSWPGTPGKEAAHNLRVLTDLTCTD